MLNWFAKNHVAVVAIGALVAPVVAVIGTIISAVVSYWAVVTAPRIQREISHDTIRMTRAQITSALYGAADHQWIVDFRQAIAEVFALSANRFLTTRAGLAGLQQEQVGAEDRIKLSAEFNLLLNKIRLMVPRADSDELGLLLTKMTFDDELATRAKTAEIVLVKARS
jgi:hypothetical protein